MSGPYRDPEILVCPACEAGLRAFVRGRLCCDACGGVMLPLADLTNAIAEDVGRPPVLAFVDLGRRARKCPRCNELMHESQLTAAVDELQERLEPQLDRCIEHGVWFDADELAKVLEVVRRDLLPRGRVTLKGIVEGLVDMEAGYWSRRFPK